MKRHIRLYKTPFSICGTKIEYTAYTEDEFCKTCKRIANYLLLPSNYTVKAKEKISKMRKSY